MKCLEVCQCMRLKAYLYESIQNPKDKVNIPRGGITFPSKLVENRGSFLKDMTFEDQDIYQSRPK